MDKSEEIFQKALAAYKQGNLQQALAGLRQCLQEDPLHSKAIYYQAVASKELEKQAKVKMLSNQAREAFKANHYQDALVNWLRVLELNPGLSEAKTGRDRARESIQTALTMGQLTEQSKEDDFFKEGLQFFRQKEFAEAAVFWDVVVTLNPQNDQARQGLNKARAAIIQQKEEEEQTTKTKINSYLQEGLDSYGAGNVLKAMENWIKILELSLDNKDALDYIVVAKADLSEADYKKIGQLYVDRARGTVEKMATETFKLTSDKVNGQAAHPKLRVMDSDTGPSNRMTEQATDKTTLPMDFGDSIEPDFESPQQAEASDTDDAFNLDDQYLDTQDAATDQNVDAMPDQLADDEMIAEEVVDELQPDFDQDLALDEELQGPIGSDDFDSAFQAGSGEIVTDHEMMESIPFEEKDDNYELDDEFVEEEEEEEALAAEHGAVVGEGADTASVRALVDKYFERGLALYKSRKYEEAIIEWKKIFDIDKNNTQAKEYIEKAITLYEASPFIDEHLVQGKTLFQQGKFEDAISAYEKILDIDPECNEAITGINKARAKLTEVVIPARQTKVKKPVEATGPKAIPQLPVKKGFDITSLFNPKTLAGVTGVAFVVALVFAYLLVYKPMQARKMAEESRLSREKAAKRIEQQVADSLIAAEMHAGLNQLDEAIHSYRQAIALDSTNTKAQEGLATVEKKKQISDCINQAEELVKNKKFDEAVQELEKASALDPGNEKLQERITGIQNSKTMYLDTKVKVNKFIERGDALFNEGKYVDAIQMYRAGLKFIPDDPEVREAIRKAEFESRRGKNVEAYLKLGLSRYESRKYDQAKEYFQKVIELDPENQEANFYLGKIEEEQKIM
ncbi:tetratricopeptide repeat protein [bacterium]|nr:tetratricopeptide repeat protein [bacterium]